MSIEIDEKEHKAIVEVANDQLSLAIGKGGQNVRLAAKLSGWRIDIKGDEKIVAELEEEIVEKKSDDATTQDVAGEEK
jgi:N utilization substance protein A